MLVEDSPSMPRRAEGCNPSISRLSTSPQRVNGPSTIGSDGRQSAILLIPTEILQGPSLRIPRRGNGRYIQLHLQVAFESSGLSYRACIDEVHIHPRRAGSCLEDDEAHLETILGQEVLRTSS
jgi:hypothetical protein